MSMKVVNEMALSASKPITVMLLEPYAGKLARTVLRGKAPARELTYSTRPATRIPPRPPRAGSGRVSSLSWRQPSYAHSSCNMAKYPINKGIGRSPEFKGLKSQYLFIFAGGLLALFVVFVIMYMAGIDQWICIGFGVISASVLVWATFLMNTKYGEWGLMKLQALRRHPRYIINRRKFLRLFSSTIKNRKA